MISIELCYPIILSLPVSIAFLYNKHVNIYTFIYMIFIINIIMANFEKASWPFQYYGLVSFCIAAILNERLLKFILHIIRK